MSKSIIVRLLLITLSTLYLSYKGIKGIEPVQSFEELLNCIRDKVLDRANYYRTNYNLGELAFNEEMNKMAQEWANHLSTSRASDFKHNPSNTSYGENIVRIPAMPNVGARVVDLWYSCIAYVNLNDDECKLYTEENIGTMTQLLWKLSTDIGVGVAENIKRKLYFVVVYFNPKGNEEIMFTDNLPEFQQNDINEGKNELKFFNLSTILISNSEKRISTYKLKMYHQTGPRRPALSRLLDHYSSNKDPEGLIHAEASRIRNQIFERSNFYREKHKLPRFKIKKQLNNIAQECANHLALNALKIKQVDDNYYGKLTCVTSPTIFGEIGEIIVDLWYNEIGHAPKIMTVKNLQGKTKSLTQLLWKASIYIGVGVAIGTDRQYFIVAYFYPRGNMPKSCSENLPELDEEDIKSGATAQKKVVRLMREEIKYKSIHERGLAKRPKHSENISHNNT